MKRLRLVGRRSCLLCGSGGHAGRIGESHREAGLKPYGAYHGGDIDSISLTNGNLIVHLPMFSCPQRGKVGLDYWTFGNMKNSQVKCIVTPTGACSYKWNWQPRSTAVLAGVGSASVGPASSMDYTVNRVRVVTGYPSSGNTFAISDYNLLTPDGSFHLMEFTSATTLETLDASGYRLESHAGQRWPG